MTSIDKTLAERESQYGKYEETARISQAIKEVLYRTPSWDRLTPAQRESLHMIANKMARILNGGPSHKDSWHDIIGYAKLVENTLVED